MFMAMSCFTFIRGLNVSVSKLCDLSFDFLSMNSQRTRPKTRKIVQSLRVYYECICLESCLWGLKSTFEIPHFLVIRHIIHYSSVLLSSTSWISQSCLESFNHSAITLSNVCMEAITSLNSGRFDTVGYPASLFFILFHFISFYFICFHFVSFPFFFQRCWQDKL